jgi:hypothetical protein
MQLQHTVRKNLNTILCTYIRSFHRLLEQKHHEDTCFAIRGLWCTAKEFYMPPMSDAYIVAIHIDYTLALAAAQQSTSSMGSMHAP